MKKAITIFFGWIGLLLFCVGGFTAFRIAAERTRRTPQPGDVVGFYTIATGPAGFEEITRIDGDRVQLVRKVRHADGTEGNEVLFDTAGEGGK